MNSLDLLYSEDVNSLSTDLVSLVQWQDKVFAIKWSDNKTVSKKSNKTKNKNPRKSRARNENSESNKPQKRLYDKDKEILIEKCPLTREFISGSKHLPHQLRRIMLTNLRHRRGGVKWFMEGLKSRDDYTPDTLIEDARWYDMKPEGCRNCPYCNECDHKTNLLQQLPPRRYECRRIAPDTVRITLAETQQLLGEAITKACKADDKKIYVIRADTGTGKTEEVLKQLLKDTCIASPTHDLAQETYSRYVATGRNGAFLWKPRPKLDDGVLNALGLEGETDEL